MEASVAGENIIKETIGSRNSLCEEESFVVMGEAEYESLPTNKLSVHMLAGGAAGIAEHCIVYPVDCVKVILIVNTAGQIMHCLLRDPTITASPHVSLSRSRFSVIAITLYMYGVYSYYAI